MFIHIFIATLLLSSFPAFAQDVFPAGIESKRAGMESVAAAKSAPALLYNPANISLGANKGWSPYVELGMVSAEYAYEHPDFDQVYVNVRSPVATLGAIYNDRSWAMGLVIFPTKNGEIALPGMPRRVGSDTMPLEVKSQETVMKVAYGIAKSIGTTRVGLSLIHGFEEKQVTASVVGASSPLVRQDVDNQSVRAVAALTQSVGALGSASISGMTATTKKFEGKEQRATDAEALPSQMVAYDPASLGLGLNIRLTARLSAQLSSNYRWWKAGASQIREGITSQATEAQLENVLETGASLAADLLTGWEVVGSIAFLPSPWGDGAVAVDGSSGQIGPGFGQTNLVDRRVVGLGLSGVLFQNQKIDLSLSNTSGSRVISDAGSSPGYYQTHVSVAALGTTLNF